MCRARERCAELERSLLDLRVEWQRDKASLVDEAQDTAQRCRTLEQEVRRRGGCLVFASFRVRRDVVKRLQRKVFESGCVLNCPGWCAVCAAA